MKYSNQVAIYAVLIAAIMCAAVSFGAQGQPASAEEREIDDQLLAPCCWTQPVSQHYSDVAEKIRNEVHEMVTAGKSRDEILNHYVAQYGERILVTPRAQGFNAMIYILPWVALILGAFVVIFLLKKMRSPAPAQSPSPSPSPLPDSRYTSAVEKEMKELDE
jgi:cytochrome c-type biogenesis protein CcmH